MQADVSSNELARVLAQMSEQQAVSQVVARRAAQRAVLEGQRKSIGLAFALAFFLGPLGLLYASPLGAVVMFLIGVVGGVLTFGVGLFFAWLGSIIWAALSAESHNRRIDLAIATM